MYWSEVLSETGLGREFVLLLLSENKLFTKFGWQLIENIKCEEIGLDLIWEYGFGHEGLYFIFPKHFPVVEVTLCAHVI